MVRLSVIALFGSIMLTPASAQEDGPALIPERLQKIAAQSPLAGRLNIKWGSPSTEDTGRYIGILAAANQIALVISMKNDRSEPSDADYEAALATLCLWPNKPPVAEPYWPLAYAAFGSEAIRNQLQAAVGPLAVELPSFIEAGSAEAEIRAQWPTAEQEYFDSVLDLESLSDAR